MKKQRTELAPFPEIEGITKQKIIEHLYQRSDIDQVIKKITGDKYLADELKSILFETLLKQKEAFLIGLYNRQEIGYWILRVLKTNFHSKESTYYRRIRKWKDREVPINDNCDVVDLNGTEYKEREFNCERVNKAIKKLKPHYQNILSIYLANDLDAQSVTQHYQLLFEQGKLVKEVKHQYILLAIREAKKQLKELLKSE